MYGPSNRYKSVYLYIINSYRTACRRHDCEAGHPLGKRPTRTNGVPPAWLLRPVPFILAFLIPHQHVPHLLRQRDRRQYTLGAAVDDPHQVIEVEDFAGTGASAIPCQDAAIILPEQGRGGTPLRPSADRQARLEPWRCSSGHERMVNGWAARVGRNGSICPQESPGSVTY